MYVSMTYRISGDEDYILLKYIVKSKRIHTKKERKYKKKSWQIQVPAAAVIPER